MAKSILTAFAAAYVLGMSNRFQMLWIDALPNSTEVVDFQPLGNRAIAPFVKQSVPKDCPLAIPRVRVAFGCESAAPNPTRGIKAPVFFNVLWAGILDAIMSVDEFKRFASYPAIPTVSLRGQAGFLSTTTHAQSRRVWWLKGVGRAFAAMMAVNKAHRLAPDPSSVVSVCLGYRRLLAATALAKAAWVGFRDTARIGFSQGTHAPLARAPGSYRYAGAFSCLDYTAKGLDFVR